MRLVTPWLTSFLTGPGKSEADAASVRANFPMRPQCGIYYFEMHVLSKGSDGYIGIGFCGGENKLERLPGNEQTVCQSAISRIRLL